jgi:hypothetical protein
MMPSLAPGVKRIGSSFMRTGYGSPPRERAPGERNRRTDYNGYTIERYRSYERHWALYDPDGELVCLTVYKRGAEEVVRRLEISTGRAASETNVYSPAPRRS